MTACMSSASAYEPIQILLLQTIEICEAWLKQAPGHECHLWAHMLAFFAKINMADQPEELREVSPFATCLMLFILVIVQGLGVGIVLANLAESWQAFAHCVHSMKGLIVLCISLLCRLGSKLYWSPL